MACRGVVKEKDKKPAAMATPMEADMLARFFDLDRDMNVSVFYPTEAIIEISQSADAGKW